MSISQLIFAHIWNLILSNLYRWRVPSPDTYPSSGIPDQFIDPWTDNNPVYLKFASDGVHVEKDYKLTYNIALDEQDEKDGRTWGGFSDYLQVTLKFRHFTSYCTNPYSNRCLILLHC